MLKHTTESVGRPAWNVQLWVGVGGSGAAGPLRGVAAPLASRSLGRTPGPPSPRCFREGLGDPLLMAENAVHSALQNEPAAPHPRLQWGLGATSCGPGVCRCGSSPCPPSLGPYAGSWQPRHHSEDRRVVRALSCPCPGDPR